MNAEMLQAGALGVLALVCAGGLKLARQFVLELRALRKSQERLSALIIMHADPRIEEYARILSQAPPAERDSDRA